MNISVSFISPLPRVFNNFCFSSTEQPVASADCLKETQPPNEGKEVCMGARELPPSPIDKTGDCHQLSTESYQQYPSEGVFSWL